MQTGELPIQFLRSLENSQNFFEVFALFSKISHLKRLIKVTKELGLISLDQAGGKDLLQGHFLHVAQLGVGEVPFLALLAVQLARNHIFNENVLI